MALMGLIKYDCMRESNASLLVAQLVSRHGTLKCLLHWAGAVQQGRLRIEFKA